MIVLEAQNHPNSGIRSIWGKKVENSLGSVSLGKKKIIKEENDRIEKLILLHVFCYEETFVDNFKFFITDFGYNEKHKKCMVYLN